MDDATLSASPYVKSTSIRAFAAEKYERSAEDVLSKFFSSSSFLNLEDDYKRSVLMRLKSDLYPHDSGDSAQAQNSHKFLLKPHIAMEIMRLDQSELSEYLFHRFRYEVYPATKELDQFPPCIQIEPTSICNYRCVFCYQTDTIFTKKAAGHMGQMKLSVFQEVVDQIAGHVHLVTLASRGEPLLAKCFNEMLTYCKGKFLGLKLNTNASFLDDEKTHAILSNDVNTVVFSAESSNKDLYEQLRVRGDFDNILKRITRFREIQSTDYPDSRTITRVSGVAYDMSRQDFQEMKDFWAKRVDQVAFVEYNPWENVYEAGASRVVVPCSDLWRRMFVWWDGKVNPCDVDYRSYLSVGHIQEKGLSQVWVGEAYNHLRAKHLQAKRGQINPCKGCTVT